MEVRIGPAALSELRTASNDYNSQRDGLGEEFLDQVQRVSTLLSEHPEMGRLLFSGRRILRISRFPYRVVDRREQSGIRSRVLAHVSQRPFDWRHRVEEPRPEYDIDSAPFSMESDGMVSW